MANTGEAYGVEKLDEHNGIHRLRRMFKKVDYQNQWLFLSTSGVHGTYTNLDDIAQDAQREYCFDGNHEPDCRCGAEYDWVDPSVFVNPKGEFRITVLVVKARAAFMLYGTIIAKVEDIGWMRMAVSNTIEGIGTSQSGNLFFPLDVATDPPPLDPNLISGEPG